MAQAPLLSRPWATPTTLGAVVNQHRATSLYAVRKFSSGRPTQGSSTTRRRIQTSSTRPSASIDSAPLDVASTNSLQDASSKDTMASLPPLSVLPLSTIIRTLGTTTISSSRLLLPPSLAIMSVLAHTTNPLLNPDKNPLLRFFLKKTFYAQFCAGENAAEVRKTVDGLKKIGYTGVLLGYAREVVLSDKQTKDLSACALGNTPEAEECIRLEVTPWANGTMETIRLAQPGDFVSIKFSGAGRQALWALKEQVLPSGELKAAIERICALAKERDIPLLIDAEQTAIQAGIDDWAMDLQRRYNTTPGHAIIYNTYQAYLKATPATLSSHLQMAESEGFTLGAKLVRGAYLGSDPRHIIHDTKEDTDRHYDGLAAALLRREWDTILPLPASGDGKLTAFPRVSLVLGSHNLQSVRNARDLNDSLPPSPYNPELAIAQLQGMADEVSCELVNAKSVNSGMVSTPTASPGSSPSTGRTRAYKYLVWGTTGECMKYLLRRAHENRDAVARTRAGRDAMFTELRRRFWARLSGRA